MWQHTGLNGDAQRIEQLGWMLFLKIFSDKDLEMELMDSKYKSPIPPEFHWVKDALQMRESSPTHHVRHPPFAEQDTQASECQSRNLSGQNGLPGSCASGTHPGFLESK